VRELRVHGVGPGQETRMLGVTSANDLEIVAVGNGTRIVRRAGPPDGTELYSWADLTADSRSRWWMLYLPFILINAAGFSFDPNAKKWAKAHGWICRGLAAGATASYVLWAAEVLVDLIGWQWRHRLLALHPIADNYWLHGLVRYGLLGLSWVALIALLGGLFWLVRSRVSRTSVDGSASRSAGLLVFHAVLAAGAVAAVAGMAVARHHQPALLVGDLVVGLGLAQGVGLALLWLVALVARRRPVGAAEATLGIAAANAAFAGTVMLAVRYLQRFPTLPKPASVTPLRGGPELALAGTLVWAVLGGGVAAAVTALYIWRTKQTSADLAPSGTDITADRPAAIPPGLVRRTGQARRSARLSHGAIYPASVFAAAFVIGGGVYIAYLVVRAGSPWNTQLAAGPGSWVTALGGVLLTALPLAVWRQINPLGKSSQRFHFLGDVWDVMLLWPAQFHPLSVPAYTDQTTDDLVRRITSHLASGEHLLISSHSEGTVLSYLALCHLERERVDLQRVTFVTYGSPLNGLYALAFPNGFSNCQNLATKLGGWVNFWRLTDPIGAPIFQSTPYRGNGNSYTSQKSQVLSVGPGHSRDVLLCDPAFPPPAGYVDPALVTAPLERDRQAYVDLAVHSYYLCEPLLKWFVHEAKTKTSVVVAGGLVDVSDGSTAEVSAEGSGRS
jgi:hypothetical protein